MTIESRDDGISVTLKREEAEALAGVAETGLAVSEALKLITNSGAAERALTALRGARGRAQVTVALRRPEGAALVHIAEVGLAVTRAVQALADLADLAAAQRGLDALKGAMR